MTNWYHQLRTWLRGPRVRPRQAPVRRRLHLEYLEERLAPASDLSPPAALAAAMTPTGVRPLVDPLLTEGSVPTAPTSTSGTGDRASVVVGCAAVEATGTDAVASAESRASASSFLSTIMSFI